MTSGIKVKLLNYEMDPNHLIGHGLIATVHPAIDTSLNPPKAVVIKSYSLKRLKKPRITTDASLIEKFNSECTNLNEVKGIPHCIQLIEIINDQENDIAHLVLEPFARNGSLQSICDKSALNEKNIRLCFFQIAEALSLIHEKNIVHRDNNPENILSDSEESFFLTDFNSSYKMKNSNELLEDTEGCLPYLSPEEVSGNEFAPKPADVWKYGATLYKIFFGKLPFNLEEVFANTPGTITVLTVCDAYETNKLSLEIPQGKSINPLIIQLIAKILVTNPLKRPSFKDILSDPAFADLQKM